MASSLSDFKITAPVIPKSFIAWVIVTATFSSATPFCGTTQHRIARVCRCFMTSSVTTRSSSRLRQKA